VGALTALRQRARHLHQYSSIRGIWNAWRFPGLRSAAGAKLHVRGALHYGRGCTVGTGANLIIPAGATLSLGNGCYLGRHVELGPSGRIEIGDETSLQDRTILLGDVSVGRYCTLAPNVYISSGRHHFDLVPHALIKDQDRLVRADPTLSAGTNRAVTVEDDCWLGINVVVMPGVLIAKGAVVGANSVVTKSVEPYTVVAGAPARSIGARLNFRPPKCIDHTEPKDLPYFYAGFAVSSDALTRNAADGGIEADNTFTLCLTAVERGSLHVVIRRRSAGDAFLHYGLHRLPVGGEFEELIFDASDARQSPPNRFLLWGEPDTVKFVVARAWVD
jgi:acetyltransferase-like isoleucine patch superfamily enzyme